ncbi:MAG TPA: hypothetical protein VF778_00305 [Xanthobacteraceae bacterium]
MILHERKALHAQRRLERLQRLFLGNRILRYKVELSLDAGIDDDGFAGGGADRLGDLIDVRVDEIQRHLRVRGLRDNKSRRQQCRRDATQCHRLSSHGCDVRASLQTTGQRPRRPFAGAPPIASHADRLVLRFAIILKNMTITALCNEIVPIRSGSI